MENKEERSKHHVAEILKYIVTEMTSPECKIEVRFTEGERTTVYQVEVDQAYRGRLIGAQGKNITSLRTIIGAIGGNNGFRAIIELVV